MYPVCITPKQILTLDECFLYPDYQTARYELAKYRDKDGFYIIGKYLNYYGVFQITDRAKDRYGYLADNLITIPHPAGVKGLHDNITIDSKLNFIACPVQYPSTVFFKLQLKQPSRKIIQIELYTIFNEWSIIHDDKGRKEKYIHSRIPEGKALRQFLANGRDNLENITDREGFRQDLGELLLKYFNVLYKGRIERISDIIFISGKKHRVKCYDIQLLS